MVVNEGRDRERQLTALHDATRELMAVEDRRRVAEIVSRTAEEVLGYDLNVVRLVSDDRTRLLPVSQSEHILDLFGERPEFRIPEGASGEVFERGEPRVFDDFSRLDDDIDRHPVQSGLYLPIGNHGVLCVLRNRRPAVHGSRSPARTSVGRTTREGPMASRGAGSTCPPEGRSGCLRLERSESLNWGHGVRSVAARVV